MSQLIAFIEKAKSDKDLMAKLDALGENAGADEIIKLAKEYSFTVTEEEIEKQKSSEDSSGELSEDELESVAGGGSANRYNPDVCKDLPKTRFECVGFMSLCWCDHHRRTHDPISPGWGTKARYFHTCVMGAYSYRGDKEGGRRGQ